MGSMKVNAIITASNGKLGLAIVIDNSNSNNGNGVLIGIITDGDVRRAVQKYQNKMFELTVKDIMTTNPKTVRPETTLNEVDKILRKYNIHALVVTDKDGGVVGIIDSFRVF